MAMIRQERAGDVGWRDALLDDVFGARLATKTAERLREGRLPADGLSFVACEDGRIIGTVRLWNVAAGPGCPALLLGPLAVAADHRNRGLGSRLVRRALDTARRLGHRAVLLVGDAPYYGRFDFSVDRTGALWLPGPYERHRLLGRELEPGALMDARGLVSATGLERPKPRLAALVKSAARVAGMHLDGPALASHAV